MAIFFLTLYKAFTIGRGIELLDVIVRDGALSLVIHSGDKSHHPVRYLVLLVRSILFVGR
jgi:hypothetical protein